MNGKRMGWIHFCAASSEFVGCLNRSTCTNRRGQLHEMITVSQRLSAKLDAVAKQSRIMDSLFQGLHCFDK